MNRPTLLSFLSDVETPVSMFHKLSQASPVAFLFESTDGDSRLARFSFLGIFPVKTIAFKKGVATITDGETQQGAATIRTVPFTNPLEVLKSEWRDLKPSQEVFKTTPLKGLVGHLPFLGGWAGAMGYGASRYFDPIPLQEADPLDVPEGFYGLYDTVILYDHLFRQITFLSYKPPLEAQALWKKIQERLSLERPLMPLFYQKSLLEPGLEDRLFDQVIDNMGVESFCQTVEKVKSLIQEGQVFQVVLAHRFTTSVTVPPFQIYRMLQMINPSPYAYYLQCPDFVYLGSSPETFVSCQDGKVTLRALAGTRPRGKTQSEDQHIEEELIRNEKELAEHRMLVDLGRNDLGRVCQPGTVQVGVIGEVSRYTHVMHMATELTGILREDQSCFDVFQSCFPRGTVSGAPKIRAMQVLSQLEPEQRGIYSGVVGYFDFLGNMDGAIAIRSALIKEGQAHIHAGAGIVYDSTPLGEFEETQNKAKSILKAVKLCEHLSQEGQRHVGYHH